MKDFVYFNSDMIPSLNVPTTLTPTSKSMIDVIQKVMIDGFDNHPVLKYKAVDNGKFLELFCGSDVSAEMGKTARVTIDSLDPLIKGDWVVWSSIGNVALLHKKDRAVLVGYPTEYVDSSGFAQIEHIKWELVYRSANSLVMRNPDFNGGACVGFRTDCGTKGIYQADTDTVLTKSTYSNSPNKVYAQVFDFTTYEVGKTFHQNVIDNGRKVLQAAHPMYPTNLSHNIYKAIYPVWRIKPLNQTSGFVPNALWSIKVTKRYFVISLNSIWNATSMNDCIYYYGLVDNAIMKDCQILTGALPTYQYTSATETNLMMDAGLLASSSADSPVVRYGYPDNMFGCLFFYYQTICQLANQNSVTTVPELGTTPSYFNSSVLGSSIFTGRQGQSAGSVGTEYLVPIMDNPTLQVFAPYRYKVGQLNFIEIDGKQYQIFVSINRNTSLSLTGGSSGMYQVSLRAIEI